MQQIEIVSRFMKQIVWGLFLEGTLAIVVGLLIFIYPQLLGMLVGTLVVVGGVTSLVLAIKVDKYSKLRIDL